MHAPRLSLLILFAVVPACSDDSGSSADSASQAGTGTGGNDAASGKRDDQVIMLDIDAEFARLNYCESVADCRGIGYPSCSTTYVNTDADLTHLNELLGELGGDSEPRACTAACQCGLLTCTDGACLASPGNCMEQLDETKLSVCL